MTKEQRQETNYLTEILKCLSGKFTEKELEKCQKAFIKFIENLKLDRLGLLRKGEVMLRRLFI